MGSRASKKKSITGSDTDVHSQQEKVRVTKRKSLEEKSQPIPDKADQDKNQKLDDKTKENSGSSENSESDSEEAAVCKTPPVGSLGSFVKSCTEVGKQSSQEDLESKEETVSQGRETTETKSKKRRKESIDAVEDELKAETNTEISHRLQKQGGFMMPTGLISELKENQGIPKLRPTKANINKSKDTPMKNEQQPQIPVLKPLNKTSKYPKKAGNEQQEKHNSKDDLVANSGPTVKTQKPVSNIENPDLEIAKPNVQKTVDEVGPDRKAQKKPIPLKRTRVGNSTENLLTDQTVNPPERGSRTHPPSSSSERFTSETTSKLPGVGHSQLLATSASESVTTENLQTDQTDNSPGQGSKIHPPTNSSERFTSEVTSKLPGVGHSQLPATNASESVAIKTPSKLPGISHSQFSAISASESVTAEAPMKLSTSVEVSLKDNELIGEECFSGDKDHEKQTKKVNKESIQEDSCKEKRADSGFQDDFSVHPGQPVERQSVALKTYTSEFEWAISEISNISKDNDRRQQETLVKDDNPSDSFEIAEPCSEESEQKDQDIQLKTGHFSGVSKTAENVETPSTKEDELEKLQAFIDLELKEFTDMLNTIDKPSDPFADANTYHHSENDDMKQ